MNKHAQWITTGEHTDGAVTFRKEVAADRPLKKAILSVSAIGVYVPYLDGKRIGTSVLMPGWTNYDIRVQYQTYDVTALVTPGKHCLEIGVGNGWALGDICQHTYADCTAMIASLDMIYEDGTKESVETDPTWEVVSSQVLFSDLYMGETIDKTAPVKLLGTATTANVKAKLIPQVGEWITEQERLAPVAVIKTPNGETVIDFGQDMTGYAEVSIQAPRGSRIVLHHGEVLDKDGNFYNANYRDARNEIIYVCSGEHDVFKPLYSFQGFRYLHVVEYPYETIDPNAFRAIVVHSEMKRTGHFRCGNEKINQLYHNVIWGQKSNYLDIPTDCPQRNERMGWTGDTQVFARTAAINYDVETFFKKWLGELALSQGADGATPGIAPHARWGGGKASAAWGDAACVIPWEIFSAYGNTTLLKEHFPMMKKWVDYMHADGSEEFLWLGGDHYGDWLAMDNGEDNLTGATSTDLIGSAFFAYSTSLLIKAGHALGYDMTDYETLHQNILLAFRAHYLFDGELHQYPDLHKGGVSQENPPKETQTAYVLILHFGLCEEKDRQRFADRLAQMIRENGTRMTTGFVGTPYLLHVLTENGHCDLAYDLLFQEKTPSWLYSVCHGATTMWEHWNGIKEDGSFWSTSMNSFNHYAYGAVFDWIFGKAIGITPLEPAYREVSIVPHPDSRLGFAESTLQTRNGLIRVHWYYKEDTVYYECDIPDGMTAHLVLPSGYSETLTSGSYYFAD